MNAPTLSPEREVVLHDALDHIMRTARASSSQTRRLRWIASRAEAALAGRPFVAAEHDQPKMVTEAALQSKNMALRLANSRLRNALAQVAGGATGYADRDTELAQIAQAALDDEQGGRA